jgi:hypothetical protein
VKRDYLDISNEDLSKYKTVDIQGNEITPSTYNIFKDSMKKTFTEMRNVMKENLPDLNSEENSESDDNDEILPLDFRTKLVDMNGDVVIQAKPLKLYGSDEDDGEKIGDLLKKNSKNAEHSILQMSSDAYLDQYKMESFKDDDENVILIQHNSNIKEKLDSIDFECNK